MIWVSGSEAWIEALSHCIVGDSLIFIRTSTFQLEAAVQGTMVMELQPIQSCKPEDSKHNQCSLTVSNKVSG